MMIRKSRIYNDSSYMVHYRVMWFDNKILKSSLVVWKNGQYIVDVQSSLYEDSMEEYMNADEVEEYIDNLVKLECL